MSALNIHINGRDYQVACDDGQEAHLGRLAQDINDRMRLINKHMGRVPENLHFVLTLLMVTDELFDAKRDLSRVTAQLNAAGSEGGDASAARLAELEQMLSEQMENVAARLEKLAKKADAA